jgi:hypothetical protein
MTRTRTRLLAVVTAVALLAPCARASTVILPADRDNTLIQTATGNLSNGSGMFLFVGRTGQGPSTSIRRAALHFDVSSLPANAVIHRVSLSLRMDKTISGVRTASLHRITAGWGEAGSNASGDEGPGTTAQSGDATWIHRVSPSTLWTTPGGDFVAQPSAQTSVAGSGNYDWSSDQMAADVQSWILDPASNHGWVLLGSETASRTAKRFRSREHGMFPPALTVDYYVLDGMAGVVNAGAGPVTDVVRINGSAGDANRVVRVATGNPVMLSFDAAPMTPSGRYALWVWNGIPCSPTPLQLGDDFLGIVVNAIPPLPGTPQPFRCLRSPELPPRICQGVAEVASARPRVPWSITDPMGASMPGAFVVQGIVQDAGAANGKGFSASNAILLVIE